MTKSRQFYASKWWSMLGVSSKPKEVENIEAKLRCLLKNDHYIFFPISKNKKKTLYPLNIFFVLSRKATGSKFPI